MSNVALAFVWIGLVPSALALPPRQAEPPSSASQAATPVTAKQADPSQSLYSAAEALDLVRFALREEGRDAARAMLSEVVPRLAEPTPGEEAAHVATLLEIDRVAEQLGSLEELGRVRQSVLALRSRLLPPDHPDLLRAMEKLAAVHRSLGDLSGAHELFAAALAARTRLLSADHPDLLAAQANLAMTLRDLGDLQGAHELFEAGLEARTRLLPADHPELLEAKYFLGATRMDLGDLAGAQELLEAVHEARTRLLPADHPDLLLSAESCAAVSLRLGDLTRAHELFEAVLEARLRLLPADHPDILSTQEGLGVTTAELGDPARAHALQEAVLAARARTLPADHLDLLRAQANLALTRRELGDLAGAHELVEAVHEAHARRLPADHPSLLSAKLNLALVKADLGDLAGAHELEQVVLEARARLLPADHPDLLAAQLNLAATRARLGDFAGAHELHEAVHGAWTRLMPADHADLLRAKNNLAATTLALGDVAGAHELLEVVHQAYTRLLPADHDDLLEVQQSLAATKAALGDLAGARELVASLLAGQRLRARALRSEPARRARAGARAELQRLSWALSMGAVVDPEHTLDARLYATLESLRLASIASGEAAHALASHPDLEREARAIAALRARLNDLVTVGPEQGESSEGWRKEVVGLAEERDRAEHGLRQRLAQAGAFVGELDAQAVARRLPPGAVAVSFLRYWNHLDATLLPGLVPPSADAFLAFVVKRDAAVVRVELGAAAQLEALVQDWRRELGKPLERGIAADEGDERSPEELGHRLRARILDPLLAAAGEDVRALHVVLDDALFLVPLDALPLEQDVRVGERLAIHVEQTLARLVREERPLAAGGGLVAAGGIDFDAAQEKAGEPAEVERVGPAALLAAASPPLGRSGRPASFEPLRQTRYEVEDIGAQHAEALGGEPVILLGGAATKSALHALAPQARFLHLATHGWFASEGFRSQLDTLAAQDARAAFQRIEATLVGFAPETLCGLALAGANRGRDALGRVPGILTAEELASLDLRGCELAVLSACETNVGIRRAGQGIQSLQTALHAAGARTAITSLWKVDDAATRRLFELFYSKLWKEKLGQAEALWQAKMALRAEGHALRDWAGWVLSGDPD